MDTESAGAAGTAPGHAALANAVRALAMDAVEAAGFDGHRRDPLAGLELEAGDFAWITRRLCEIADESCAGRVVSTLEGGYDLDALATSAAAHVAALAE